MTGRINEESAVLEYHDLGHAADEETAERANPSVPPGAQHGWEYKTHQHRNEMNMSMLPHYQRILLQVRYVIERRLRPELEQEPADVGVEKTFGDVVRVFFVIDMFMMSSVVTRPHQN